MNHETHNEYISFIGGSSDLLAKLVPGTMCIVMCFPNISIWSVWWKSYYYLGQSGILNMAKRTFKIDRLSNPSLELGLRTNAILTGSSTAVTSSKVFVYDSDVTSLITTDNHEINKKYVDNVIASAISTALNTAV